MNDEERQRRSLAIRIYLLLFFVFGLLTVPLGLSILMGLGGGLSIVVFLIGTLGAIAGGSVSWIGHQGAKKARDQLSRWPLARIADVADGRYVRIQGRVVTPAEATGPYSGQRTAFVFARTSCIDRKTHREKLPLSPLHYPDELEVADDSGRATIPMAESLLLTRHTYGPKRSLWSGSDANRELSRRIHALYPDAPAWEGTAEHYELEEQYLMPEDDVTVSGRAARDAAGAVTIAGGPEQELLVTNLSDDEILQQGRASRGIAHVALAMLLLGLVGVVVGLLGMTRGGA